MVDSTSSSTAATSLNPPPGPPPSTTKHSSRRLHVLRDDPFLREEHTNRAWLLRGVNLSGSCKFPKHPVSQPSHVGGEPFLPPHPTLQSTTTNLIKRNDTEAVKNADGNVNTLNCKVNNNPKENTSEVPRISFVGRPFELQDADEHLARLRHWGFRMIRWVITWEAIEHQAPGVYDKEFLDYTVLALLKAKEYGFKVMIDFHQDVWSRFSGGSGAPLWTLHLAGLDPHHFAATRAAAVHNTLAPGEPLLRMVWLTNYYKLACATMFTLFYAGKLLAPKCTFENGVNIQDYLQQHFLGAISAMVDVIHQCKDPVTGENLLEDSVVIGYDSWNEPSCGWIGLERLDVLPDQHDMRQGEMPTPLQSMMLGEGLKVKGVAGYRLGIAGPVKIGSKTIDPSSHISVTATAAEAASDLGKSPIKIKAWLSTELRERYDAIYKIHRDPSFPKAGQCLWAQHGVWSVQDCTVLQQDYFRVGPRVQLSVPGRSALGQAPIDWVHGHWLPFAQKMIDIVRKTHPKAILFMEPPVYTPPPNLIDKETAAIIDADEDECAETHKESTRRRMILPDSLRKYAGDRRSGKETLESGSAALRRRKSKGHRHDHNAYTSLMTNMVYTPHHYDDLVLLTKRYLGWMNIDLLGLSRGRHKSLLGSIVFGRKKTKTLFGKQIREIQLESSQRLGETGLHFDVGVKEEKQAGRHTVTSTGGSTPSFEPTTQFRKAFDNILNGLDLNLVHYTLWNYTAENDAQYGDGWNGENLSLYTRMNESKEQVSPPLDLDRGGRAVEQFCRPYPVATVGRPIKLEFDRNGRKGPVFRLWTVAPSMDARLLSGTQSMVQSGVGLGDGKDESLLTEIYVPRIHFPGGPARCRVRVSDGSWRWDTDKQLLWWAYGPCTLPLQSDRTFSTSSSPATAATLHHEHWIEITFPQ
ncbi:hypothetical protein BGZ94_010243 [Podila epigama]|nr:hypothetical protein BGZ94_010243 [Podila epigama]